MSPLFYFRREKYASGFSERLGHYPKFIHDGRRVIWIHCVSVGETNAAKPLVDQIQAAFPDHRIIVSTTTQTGHELAKKVFAGKADAIFYFPFDWKFSVRRALTHFKPSFVLLMETEIWPRFIREARRSGAKIAIVNGRLSERSYRRYSKLKFFIKNVLCDIDLALMQGANDANRMISLGLSPGKAVVTGNLKFDIVETEQDDKVANELTKRFGLDNERPIIIAASTHEPEERWVLDAFCSLLNSSTFPKPRLVIAPRHPERFESVVRLLKEFREDPDCEFMAYSFVRRSDDKSEEDVSADIILLDSIGELRAIYRSTKIAFVGGSLIPHGGQSILEPAAAGNAIITGPHTFNFSGIISTFLANDALIQLPDLRGSAVADELFVQLADLIEESLKRQELAENARSVIEANRGASQKTIRELRKIISKITET